MFQTFIPFSDCLALIRTRRYIVTGIVLQAIAEADHAQPVVILGFLDFTVPKSCHNESPVFGADYTTRLKSSTHKIHLGFHVMAHHLIQNGYVV